MNKFLNVRDLLPVRAILIMLASAVLIVCTYSVYANESLEFETLISESYRYSTQLPKAKPGKITVIPAKPHKGSDLLWERVIDGFKLDGKSETAVKIKLAELINHRRSINRMLLRASPYFWEIVEEVEARNLPLELALLPAIESRFNPRAKSLRRASGLWQIMPYTAYHLGLEQNWWFDARLDVNESTQAALDYLEYLYARFDDWILALAAYNCGEARLQRAIDNANGNTDFWELDLPNETQDYVPKILALSILIDEHEDFGIRLPDIPNQQTTETVLFSQQVNLALVANIAGIELSTLQFLNPSLLRWATPPDGPHRLRVPAGISNKIQQIMSNVPGQQWSHWNTFRVSESDNLIRIAIDAGIHPADARKFNSLDDNVLKNGQLLSMPSRDYLNKRQKPASLIAHLLPKSTIRIKYEIVTGDTLWDIANRFSVSVTELVRWNGLASNSILRPGNVLIVWIDPDTGKSA